MQRAELHVAIREKIGKGVARSLRREGRIPGVVYGGQDPPQPIDMDGRELWQLLHAGGGEHLLVNLYFGAEKDQGTLTLLKDLQHNPLHGKVEHVDFQRISVDRPILTTVPIRITGSSAGEREGGVLEHVLRELNIECLPLEIPDAIEVDISPLGIGQSIHVRDIAVPERVRVLSNPEAVVVLIVSPTRVTAAEVAKEVVEGEGAEAPAESAEQPSE